MNAEPSARSRAEIVDEASKWTVGLGIVGMALFPLALPIVILTVVALLPLAVPLLAVGLVAGVIALPVLLIRKLAHSESRMGAAGGGRPRSRRPGRPPTTGAGPSGRLVGR